MTAHRTVLLCSLIVVGCKSSPRSSGTPTEDAHGAGGRQPIMSLAIWPERWASIAGLPQLRALGGEVPSSFWASARDAADDVGLRSLALPPPGIDASGPITLEVHRPKATFETIGLAAATRAPIAAEDRVGLHARVTFAASDPAALATALEAAIAAREEQTLPVLRVLRGDRAVALDVFTDDVAAAQLAAAAPAIALPFESGHESAARAALRLEGLGDLTATSGMLAAYGALASYDGGEAPLLLAQGTSEVLTGYLLTDPASSASAGLFVDVAEGGGLQVAFALTEAGKAALTAGGLASSNTMAIDRVNWSAVIAAAPRPPLFPAGAESQDVATAFHECGGMCFVWAAMGNALGLASLMRGGELAGIEEAMRTAFPTGELSWLPSGLVFVHAPGAKPAGWNSVATGAVTRGAAEACYRKALLAVRLGLRAEGAELAGLADAEKALDGAASCVKSDAAIAARHRALREMIAAIRALPRGERRAPPPVDNDAPPPSSADDPPPPEEDDRP